MFAKLFQKSTQPSQSQQKESQGGLTSKDFKPRVAVHYGIPSTASILAYDPFQQLLAIGTLDGRIKVIGGDNIEGLLVSPKSLPFKNLEFLHNQGLLASVSNENEIQVWDLENRCLASSLQWESNITSFSIVYGTNFMYIGDEYGYVSIMKYDAEDANIVQLPYHIPANLIAEAAEIPLANHQSVVGLLPQPCSFGNRVLIAYDNGLIVLWDVTEDRAVFVRGSKDLQLEDKCINDSPNVVSHEQVDSSSNLEEVEKEISSLCWVSSDGSVLAVGYVDGDILLWNLMVSDCGKDQAAKRSSSDVVKLQLSSGDRRLPVIVLHWSSKNTDKGCGGQLFVYGGDEIGSDEVLTILSLEWSSGIAKLKCVDRVDLPLYGSFADMTLLPNASEAGKNESTSLFVLTNPGQLHFYDSDCLSRLKTEPEKKYSIQALQYPAVVPTVEPSMTVGKLLSLCAERNISRDFLKTTVAAKLQAVQSVNEERVLWPLSGGVPSQISLDENKEIERIYIAGYQDGSVRVWDATSPVLSVIVVLGVEVGDTEIAGATASISALDFSSNQLLAVGNECGLINLYSLKERSDKRSFYVVTETNHEVKTLQSESGSYCTAIFSLLNSPVRTLQYISSGDRLAVGFECGQVAMLDVGSLSVLFITESVFHSAVISLSMEAFPDSHDSSLDSSEEETSNDSAEIAFLLTKDAHVVMMDSTTGNIIHTQTMHTKGELVALSLYVLDGNLSVVEGSMDHQLSSSQDTGPTYPPEERNHQQGDIEEVKNPLKPMNLGQPLLDSQILLCCENALYLYPLKSFIQGEKNYIRKVDLANPCAWSTIFKRDAKVCGLIIVYQSGLLEARSLPDLEVVGQATLGSILRWNYKANMDKTMSSSDKGLITMVNGSEFAFVSLLAFENDLRLPEALPCLHDKVVAAGADSAVNYFRNQKKDQTTTSGAFAGIIQGFKGVKFGQDVDYAETHDNLIAHLESIFSRFPFSDFSLNIEDDQGLELNIDDIEIDETVTVTSTLMTNNDRTETETERVKLFEGGSTDTKPRARTREEIIAKYRNTGDATSAAAQAKDKLLERQEKLERLSRRTEELQNGAESFAAMANELAKTMEKRKWWHI